MKKPIVFFLGAGLGAAILEAALALFWHNGQWGIFAFLTAAFTTYFSFLVSM